MSAVKRRSFVVLHNIPSPYRLHMFEVMHRHLAARDIDFHVHFMSAGHDERPEGWRVAIDQLPFRATLHRDFGITLRGNPWHFNPGILRDLIFSDATYIMIGNPWATLTNLIAPWIPTSAVRVAWCEPNTQIGSRTRGLGGTLKRSLLANYDVVAVPGRDGVEFMREHLKLEFPSRFAELPNIVDERDFGRVFSREELDMARAGLNVPVNTRLAIWPARLVPAKGVVEFLSVLTPQDLEGWALRIIGEGPLRHEVMDVIADRRLGAKVEVHPYVGYEKMPALYGAADLFVLPSQQDPNPLSVVEALHAGLPVLLSKRVGNFPEAFADNGWSLEPNNGQSVRNAVQNAFGATGAELSLAGVKSKKLAEFWRSDAAVQRFFNVVLPLAD